MRILIVYGTTEGQTRKIARFLAEHFEGLGHQATLKDASGLEGPLNLAEVDGVVVAASVHLGSYQSAVRHLVAETAGALDAMPSAFVSVSLAAASPEPDDLQHLADYVRDFVEETGWQPRIVHHAAGAFRFTKYDFFKRWAMRWAMPQMEGRTEVAIDPRGDTELTDWEALEDFAKHFAELV